MEKERGIPVDFMLDKIKKAILTACKSSYNGNDDAIINMNPDTGVFEVYLQKTVVEEVEDKGREISLQDAREIDPNTAVGEKVGVQLDTKQFGRIAAQTARNIIRQGIRDGERGTDDAGIPKQASGTGYRYRGTDRPQKRGGHPEDRKGRSRVA